MSTQMTLPTFTLETKGDMANNWDFFEETFNSYATLMGYRDSEDSSTAKAKELAALKYALPKEARLVLKNSITWSSAEEKDDPGKTREKLRLYYAGTKNIIHERVIFNKMMRHDSEPMSEWETRCKEQGSKCEYCENCSAQLIRDRYIVGINDDALLSKLVNSAVKDSSVSLETIVLNSKQYESTKNRIGAMSSTANGTDEQVRFTQHHYGMKGQPSRNTPMKPKFCPWCAKPAHPRGKSECPAQGKQCHSCGRLNHISRACLHPFPNWRDNTEKTGSKGHSSQSKTTKQQTHLVESDQQIEEDFQYSNFSLDLQDANPTHNIYSTEKISENPIQPTNKGLQQKIQQLRISLQEAHSKHVYAPNRKGKKYFTVLQLASSAENAPFIPVKFQIDSAATCNTIPLKFIHQIVDPRDRVHGLRTSSSTIRMYNDEITRPVGVIDLVCMKGNNCLNLQFQVLDGKQFDSKPPLLSGTDCELLNIMKVNADEIHAVSSNHQQPDQTSKIQLKSPASQSKCTTPLTEAAVKSTYPDVFRGLGCIGEPVHIVLDDTIQPIQTGIRRYPVQKTDKIASRINEMIDQGLLERVTDPTPWCSPMCAVERPDKPTHPVRICIDPVQTLNKAIKRPLYPMPTLEENLHKLVNAKCFSLVDALTGFNQVRLDEESSLLTTMHTPVGRVRWLRLPFGISSAPEEFQRRQKEVLEGLHGIINVADDILIYGTGDTHEDADQDHDTNLRALLQRCREKNLKLNPDKLKFKTRKLKFMGHIISEDGLTPDSSKIDAILEMPTPVDKKSVQRFVGLCSFLSPFLPSLSEMCFPLREISKPQDEFSWSSTQAAAFSAIKKAVSSAPVLKFFDPSIPVTLQVDASDYGLGAALLQNNQPVAYCSSTLTKSEQNNLAQIEKECLAIVHALNRWDQWLYGHRNILVETDHKPLETIFKNPTFNAPKRLQRMMVKLKRYSFSVHYRKGSTMWLADALSRAPLPRNFKSDDKFEVFASEIPLENKPDRISDHTFKLIQTSTCTDPILSHLIPYITHGWPETKSQLPPELVQFWSYRSELTLSEGVIYKGCKVVIPTVMRARMLEKIHSAHQGVENSLKNAGDTLFWPSIRSDIRNTCENCTKCAEYASQHQKEPMMSHPTPDLPWQYVSQDIFSYCQNNYLVTVDHFSDYFEMDKLPDTLASTIVDTTKSVFARHGSPVVCLTDNGPQFISVEYSEFAKSWNFIHKTSSPYYSQSNGRAEAAVKTAKSLLKKCEDPKLGLLHLRNCPTKGHSASPVQRLMSRRTRTSLPVTHKLLLPEVVDSNIVRDEMNLNKSRAKSYYDRTAGPELPDLRVGNFVYIKPPPAERSKPWSYGKIVASPQPRSYVVETGTGTVRRNRRHLRIAAAPASVTPNTQPDIPLDYHPPSYQHDPTAESAQEFLQLPSTMTENSPSPTEPIDTHLEDVKEQPQAISTNVVPQDTNKQSPHYITRSGRISKPPVKYE